MNWVGGTAPSGSVGTLTFPALTSGNYETVNDITGLSANAISIDDGVGYSLNADAITLGSGGLSAAPSTSDTGAGTLISFPITLGASQTWSITGGSQDQLLQLRGGVTGSTDTLGMSFSSSGILLLRADVEVGAVTLTGDGVVQLGGGLNGTDGNAVGLSGGVELDALFGGGTVEMVGPVTSTGATLDLADSPSSFVAQLGVDGGVTLDSTSTLDMGVVSAGTTAGTDFSQLSATGAVSLAGAQLSLGAAGLTCPTLNVGDVDTLITTTGLVTGTFAGVPDGTTIPVSCSPGTPPTVRINYAAHAVTATVVTAGSSGKPTTTTLSSSPGSPVTNQMVRLTATVTPSSAVPSGTVEFENNGTAIAGCSSQGVAFHGSAYTATCQTEFTAASSPEALTAMFTPAGGSGLQGSMSLVVPLTVGKDSTATALMVSSATPPVGASVTYTATVTPGHAGGTEPLGAVQFLDSGTPVGGCSGQSLTAGVASSTATCTLSYPAPGAHSITASYQADANFTGSTSSSQTVTVQPPPSFMLTIALAGTGAGTVTGSGISCPGTCASSYAEGTSVSLTATPAFGSTFAGWSGACSGTGPCNLTIIASQAATATFTASPKPPPGPSVAQIRASLLAQLAPVGRLAKIGALRSHRGYRFTFKALEAGQALIQWFFVPKGAHVSSAKPVLIASGRKMFTAAGKAKITIRVTAAGKRLLKHAKRLKVTAKATFTRAGKAPVTALKTSTLRR